MTGASSGGAADARSPAPYWQGFAASSMGPATAVIFTNPFEVAKVRQQMDGELQAKRSGVYRGTLGTLRVLASAEGWPGLQAGLNAAVVREGTKNLFRIGAYQPILDVLKGDEAKPATWQRLLAGACSGMTSAYICNPLDLVKTRLQARGRGTLQARGAAGAPAPSLSILHGFREVVAEGAAVQHLSRRQAAAQALWRGAHVSALRSALATAANMPAYTVSKEKLLAAGYSDGTLLHMFCGMVSGVATCTANNPVDVLRSRLYNQPTDPATGRGLHYNSPLHAAARIWQSEGPLAFYKGYGAHCLRAAPHFVLAFAFIEQSKRLLQWASSPA